MCLACDNHVTHTSCMTGAELYDQLVKQRMQEMEYEKKRPSKEVRVCGVCMCVCNACTYHTQQMFRGGKLLQLCTKLTIHYKTSAVHQAKAIMYYTQQMIQRKYFCDWLKTAKVCPFQNICRVQYMCIAHVYV